MESLTNSPPDRFNFVEKRFFSASLSENQIFQQNKYVKIFVGILQSSPNHGNVLKTWGERSVDWKRKYKS